MCGIIATALTAPCGRILFRGLEKLEYRGYDSAGAAFLTENTIRCFKRKGRVARISRFCHSNRANVGIAHTRWATHGKPADANAHPHSDHKIALVHNGIIENSTALCRQYGFRCTGDTDSEVLMRLISHLYQGDLLIAVKKALALCVGSWAIAVISKNEPETIVCASHQSPLVVSHTQLGSIAASDVRALPDSARRTVALNDGEFAVLQADCVRFYDSSLSPIEKEPRILEAQPPVLPSRVSHTESEIHEIPAAVENAIESASDAILQLPERFALPKAAILIGCGTAYHACLSASVAANDLRIFAMRASEFCTYPQDMHATTVVAVSQSGETADTLYAVRFAKAQGATVVSLVNRRYSTLERLSDLCLYTNAGPEIAVAATKSYVCQLAVLELLLDFLFRRESSAELCSLPSLCKATVALDLTVPVRKLSRASGVMCLGQHADFATATEGALKIKEICYLYAEGYHTAELKHGSLALIRKNFPVIAVVTDQALIARTKNALTEAKSRGAYTAVITPFGAEFEQCGIDSVIALPECTGFLARAASVIPLQKIALGVCLAKGNDPDRPRNLAKSVTVP